MTDRPRHYHYASAEGALEGLWATPADALFIDLEDGVRAELKDAAREES
jgi:citrate lyase beta subunit